MTVGVMPWNYYGKTSGRELPKNADFVNCIDDDLGFTTDLVAGAQELFETTIPYPAEWDQDTEVVMLHRAKCWTQDQSYTDNSGYALATNLSYLDRRPEAGYRGLKIASNEEYQKSIFAPDMKLGRLLWEPSSGSLGEGRTSMVNYGWDYTPEIKGGLSMFFPIYMDFYNQSFGVTVTSGAEVNQNFDVHDRLIFQYFYTIRRMTRRESDFWNSLNGLPMRWSQLSN